MFEFIKIFQTRGMSKYFLTPSKKHTVYLVDGQYKDKISVLNHPMSTIIDKILCVCYYIFVYIIICLNQALCIAHCAMHNACVDLSPPCAMHRGVINHHSWNIPGLVQLLGWKGVICHDYPHKACSAVICYIFAFFHFFTTPGVHDM